MFSQPVACPGCDAHFLSPACLAEHLSLPETLCSLLSTDRIPMLISHSLFQHPGEHITGHYHPNLGYIFGKAETLMDKLQKDNYKEHQRHAPQYPFQDEGEWELAKFLSAHLTQMAINQFLKLKWVHHGKFYLCCTHISSSNFKPGQDLHSPLLSS